LGPRGELQVILTFLKNAIDLTNKEGCGDIPLVNLREPQATEESLNRNLCENHVEQPPSAVFCRRGRLLYKILIFCKGLG
jgi:hypothetical protein